MACESCNFDRIRQNHCLNCIDVLCTSTKGKKKNSDVNDEVIGMSLLGSPCGVQVKVIHNSYL